MVKKDKNKEENDLIKKLDNRWEFLAFVLKFRLKELLAVLLFIAVIILIFQNSGIDFNGIIDSIFGSSK